jgi:hypothetical protein
VAGGVADVVLAGRVVLGLQDELLGLLVVRRVGAERLHVGAVAGLGHREGAEQRTRGDVGHVLLVVALGAELEHGAAEEAELHAELDQHRQVAVRRGLEGRHRGADVAAAAVLLGQAVAGLAGGGELDDDVADLVAVVVPREGLGLLEDRGVLDEVLPHPVAHVAVAAVEQVAHGGDVDVLVLEGVGGHGVIVAGPP